MNLKEAVAVAKQQVSDIFAPDAPQQIRLEHFIYDDHLAVWSLTIGFVPPGRADLRSYKIVRVAATDKSVLSVSDP
jgi:hypothetical protein